MSPWIPTLGTLAELACLLEATARKPGNVHPGRDFADASYLDFVLSAVALGRALDGAGERGVGLTCHAAVEATRAFVGSNTNLGLVLALTPLAAVPRDAPIREGAREVLARTTPEDARWVYRAIRLAAPGGLGEVAEQDVRRPPDVPLLEAMRLAEHRDTIARQYVNGFAEVLDIAHPAIARAMGRFPELETVVIACFLELLAAVPDTLIARKRGDHEAREASARAGVVLESGWPTDPGSIDAMATLDHWMRAEGNSRNPGTTADLVAAGLFVALRDGTIPLPVVGRKWWSPAMESRRG